MTELRSRVEPFACAPGLRLESHEKVAKLQFDALNDRFQRLEMLMERLERRLWLAVYGVAGVILAEAFQKFMNLTP
ncbi:GTA head formation protein, RCAP_rcc01685 family [Sagittula sp. S175]|uniref:GTA head formation protein, RCAP_rcc01685 family n=1 Tax=Sagittula sp. S175 TaxID=3415129 RepID=UPI003C7AEC59